MNNSITIGNNNIHQNIRSDANFKIKNNILCNDLKNMDSNISELNPLSISLL